MAQGHTPRQGRGERKGGMAQGHTPRAGCTGTTMQAGRTHQGHTTPYATQGTNTGSHRGVGSIVKKAKETHRPT